MSSSRQHVHDDQWSGNLETTRAERSLWLMKCPLMVSKTWQEQTRAHTSDSSHLPILAKVVRSIDPLRPQNSSSVEYIMELAGVPGNASNAGEAGDEGVNVPKFYEMNMAGDIIPLCVFSESNQGKVAMEGKVEHKFDMKPSNTGDPEYHKICRVRKKKSEVKVRQTQLIHNDRGELMRPMPGMVGLVPSNSKDKKKTTPMKGSDMKRTRRDRSELEDIMFKLFERQPNWALKQLVQETDQPAQFLKEILNELCIYNKRGTNQGTYELKPEYRKSNEEADAE